MKSYLLLSALLIAVCLACVSPASSLAVESPAAESVVETVHLNRASAEELQKLPGIGPSLSTRIIDYREAHGPFRTVDQLTEVKGIGQAKLAKFREQLSID